MTLDSYLAGSLMILGSAAFAVLGLFLVRRIFNVRDLVAVHEISGQYLSIVGTMYAVLLGLIVVDAMGRFQVAVTVVEQEANSLSELIYLAGRMPEPQRSKATKTAVAYADLVINQEWSLLSQGKSLSEAREAAINLLRLSRDWEPYE